MYISYMYVGIRGSLLAVEAVAREEVTESAHVQ
jgi:hypothetical protein